MFDPLHEVRADENFIPNSKATIESGGLIKEGKNFYIHDTLPRLKRGVCLGPINPRIIDPC